jgi:prenyltransferase beta subunit
MKRSGSMNICALLLASMMISVLLASTVFALDTDYPLNPSDESIIKAIDYLRKCQNEDGGFSEPDQNVSDISTTSWVVIALASTGEDPHEWINETTEKSPIDYLKENLNATVLDNDTFSPPNAYARTILALVAAGENSRNFNGTDYVGGLKKYYNETEGHFVNPIPEYQNSINHEHWCILALIAAGEWKNSEIIENTKKFVEEHQNEDGGWGWAIGAGSDADCTAAAIQALIAAGENPSSNIIRTALIYLKTQQDNETGGFTYFGTPSLGPTSLAVQAIVSVGEDPTSDDWTLNGNNSVDFLLNLKQNDGHFLSDMGGFWWSDCRPCWQTTQAIPALLGMPYPIFCQLFDTGISECTYPSIMGMHNGTITPRHSIRVSRVYTYSCPGTGGHAEDVIFYYENETEIAEGHWNGYKGDWHNIMLSPSLTLIAGHTYNYTIKTGSYPQIIHKDEFNATGGIITCTQFTDANGHTYNDWIPAIKLYSE